MYAVARRCTRLVLGVAAVALAARAAPALAQSPVALKLTVAIAGQSRTVRGLGQCRHEPRASIYGMRAALWLAQYAGDTTGTPRVSLSYWRPAAGGADQFQLSVSSKGKTHVINTIRGATPAGSGQSSFRPTALGGRFEIRGTAQDGAALQVTIECARFGGIVAEGG